MARVAMLIRSLAGGGAERTTLRIAEGLAEHGHRVDIVLFRSVIAFPREIPPKARLIVLCSRREWRSRSPNEALDRALWRRERAPASRLPRLALGLLREFADPILLRRTALRRALRLARYFERERPDIVFASLPLAEYAAFSAARLVARRPSIVPIVHDLVKSDDGHTRRRRLLFPYAAHVVAVSRDLADNVSSAIGVAQDRIAAVHNPAFTRDLVRQAAAEPDHPWLRDGSPPVVLGVGRLAPQKDFSTLIEAFRLVLAERDCRLVILGEGAMRRELEERVRAVGLAERVSLPGWTSNPFAFMARAALFVLSSRHEGFGNVLVEALACGCPAVATDCPFGPSEILEDRSLLAPVADPEALAAAMLRALARAPDRAALRAQAARFSIDRAADAYDGLIARIMARPGATG